MITKILKLTDYVSRELERTKNVHPRPTNEEVIDRMTEKMQRDITRLKSFGYTMLAGTGYTLSRTKQSILIHAVLERDDQVSFDLSVIPEGEVRDKLLAELYACYNHMGLHYKDAKLEFETHS